MNGFLNLFKSDHASEMCLYYIHKANDLWSGKYWMLYLAIFDCNCIYKYHTGFIVSHGIIQRPIQTNVKMETGVNKPQV